MKKTIVGLIMILSLVPVKAQERKLFWDGYDWQKINYVTREYPEYRYWIKSAYLSGLFDSKLFYQVKAMGFANSCSDSVFSDLIEPAEMRSLITGLDSFYQDDTVKYLPLPSALIATIMIQQNHPPAEISQFIRDSQKWINGLVKTLMKH
jgi:ABC-type cobalt transport system substrate-binding protein